MILSKTNMKQTQLWNLLVFSVMVLSEVSGQPQGLASFETSACHGSSETFNATCNSGNVIAVGDITMGAKLTSSGCELFYNSSFDYDTCCAYDQNDCTFPFNDNNQYHDQCNGDTSCMLGAQFQRILDNCDTLNGTFGADGGSAYFSHYMSLNYYCVEDEKMVEMCSGQNSPVTRENTEVYIWNRDFTNSEIQPSDLSCNCSVEIDNCVAGIDIYTMYRKLTGDGDGVCNQTLRVVGGEDGTVHYEWSCSDNSLDFETNSVQETYIHLSLENDRNSTDGKFWLGFRGSSESNITVNCPPVVQQYCISNATTTTTTTTNATATATATTTSATTIIKTTTTTTLTTNSTTNSTEETKSSSSALSLTTSTAPSKRPSLEEAVIALSVVGAVLLVTVLVLACCLHRTRMNAERDTEKVTSDNTHQPQQVLPAILLNSDTSDRKSVPPSATVVFNVPSKLVDAGCQAGLAHQKAETDDFACQVELVQQETVEIQKEEKGTETVPTSRSHSLCQTDGVQKKNHKVQVNINLNAPLTTASSQTDDVTKNSTLSKSQTFLNEMIPEKHLNEKIPSQKAVANGTIVSQTAQVDKLNKDETVSLISETDTRQSEQKTLETSTMKNKPKSCQHKQHKKKRSNKSKTLSSVRDSPADLESIMPELKRETPVQCNQGETLVEEAFDEITDSEVDPECNGNIQTIQVAPCGAISERPKDIRHMERMRCTIAYSFFSKERFETKLLKRMYKKSKSHRHKKSTKTSVSDC